MTTELFKETLKWLGVIIVISAILFVVGIFGETAQVAKDEFGAKASLKKYEWFINTSNEIDKLSSDIKIYENKQLMCSNRIKDRIASEQCMLWLQEVAGIKSAYNDVVSEYNSASSKFNWEFYNTQNIKPKYERR